MGEISGGSNNGDGGSSILRFVGNFQANTSGAVRPPDVTLAWVSTPVDGEQLVFSSTAAGSKSILFKADGSGDVDISSGDAATINTALAAFIGAASMTNISAGGLGSGGALGVTIQSYNTGASELLQVTVHPAGYTVLGGGYGADPSGAITELLVADAVAGKKVKLLNARVDGHIDSDGMVVALYLYDGDNYTPLTAEVNTGACQTLEPARDSLPYWLGRTPGERLYFEMYGGTLPTDGSVVTVEVEFEQSD